MLARYKWAERATAKIRFRPDQEAVARELTEHIQDLLDHCGETGMGEEAAEAAALAAMGDPEAIAEELGRLHRPWLGYLWRVSQGLLLAAIGVCLVLCAIRVFSSPRLYDLPGWEVCDRLTWRAEAVIGEPGEAEEYELIPSGLTSTGGYTIRAERAVLRRGGGPVQEAPWWTLILYLHIDVGWRGEELYWGPNVIAEVRDSAGNCYNNGSYETNRYYRFASSSAAPFLGQKAVLALDGVPEDTAWVEIDIGYGELARTLHITLTKEAGT